MKNKFLSIITCLTVLVLGVFTLSACGFEVIKPNKFTLTIMTSGNHEYFSLKMIGYSDPDGAAKPDTSVPNKIVYSVSEYSDYQFKIEMISTGADKTTYPLDKFSGTITINDKTVTIDDFSGFEITNITEDTTIVLSNWQPIMSQNS